MPRAKRPPPPPPKVSEAAEGFLLATHRPTAERQAETSSCYDVTRAVRAELIAAGLATAHGPLLCAVTPAGWRLARSLDIARR